MRSVRRRGGLRRGYEPVEYSTLRRPRVDERLGRDPSRCEAKRERDNHDVVERSDDRQKLGDQVNR